LRKGGDVVPKTEVIYSKLNYDRDSKAFDDAMNGRNRLNLNSFRRLMVHELCTCTDILQTRKIGAYPLERIQDAIRSPWAHPDMLLDISRTLMNLSQFYMRLNNYFARMGLFNYSIDVYDVKTNELNTMEKRCKLRDSYMAVCSEFEKMGFKHEMTKIMSALLVEDIYCGLIFEDSTDFFILKINPSICKIKQIQDGVFNFKLRLSGINPLEIGNYPDYVQQAYIDYCNNNNVIKFDLLSDSLKGGLTKI